jgi:aspartyl-tRNA(Asn)/glutamyl-tRNA(Gln) amidotransferase subunit C
MYLVTPGNALYVAVIISCCASLQTSGCVFVKTASVTTHQSESEEILMDETVLFCVTLLKKFAKITASATLKFFSSFLTMATIDQAEVRRVAELARLALTPAEEEAFTTQLSSILQYFEQLSELDTENVEPTTRAIDVSNITRPDELKPAVEPEAMLAIAPEAEGEFFRVPQILGSEE